VIGHDADNGLNVFRNYDESERKRRLTRVDIAIVDRNATRATVIGVEADADCLSAPFYFRVRSMVASSSSGRCDPISNCFALCRSTPG